MCVCVCKRLTCILHLSGALITIVWCFISNPNLMPFISITTEVHTWLLHNWEEEYPLWPFMLYAHLAHVVDFPIPMESTKMLCS